MRYLKGQTSFEQLFVTAVGITFVGVMFFLSVIMSSDTVRNMQATDSVERIVRAADLVYAMGPGSRISVEVFMPDNIHVSSVLGNRILLRVGMTSGDNDIFAFSDAQLLGNITNRSGRQTVSFIVDNSSNVLINSTG